MNSLDSASTAFYAPELWITLLKIAAMLFFILGALIFVLFVIKYILRRYGNNYGQSIIKTVTTYYLSPKERIVLIDVLGEKILLGITPQGMSRLAKINKDITLENSDVPEGLFMSLLKRKQGK